MSTLMNFKSVGLAKIAEECTGYGHTWESATLHGGPEVIEILYIPALDLAYIAAGGDPAQVEGIRSMDAAMEKAQEIL